MISRTVRARLTLFLAALVVLAAAPGLVEAAPKVRVLFVGGDWKSQLPNYQGKTPLRGHFVRREVDKAAPGQFEFTLWTNYEFQQYADFESLRRFDVVVVGDVMGQSLMPRTVEGLAAFVAAGGGFWYCDNHKAFSFNTLALSFDIVLPIHVLPFRPFGPEPNQPICNEKELKVKVKAPNHPIVKGLDWDKALALRAARYGKLKKGAEVIATSPGGKEIWVVWQKGKGRAFWSGGVFANDELSEDFAKWPQFGKFYAQALGWLAEKSTSPRKALVEATATGTIAVDLTRKGPAVTSAHFGIHGQEDSPGGSYAMKGADLALYNELKLAGTFARTGAASPGDFVKRGKGGQYDYPDLGTDLTSFDWAKFDFKKADAIFKDVERIEAVPISLAWCPWWGPNWPQGKRYAKYFAAYLEHVNGKPGTKGYRARAPYFEIMNEPNLGPAPEVLNRYADFFNETAGPLRKRYPGVKFGCGGFFEWSYVQAVIDRCGPNLDWISRHPYGHTGEAVFYLQDRYAEHARKKGLKGLKFIITEWDFWLYGEPAFDYAMMRWKPLIDHADSCVGTLHYRWREYQEGGYVFGLHGEFDTKYGELPPEWPNPGKNKPISYRYNGFWIMRDCRGPQYAAKVDVPALKTAEGPRAYAVATCDGKQYNVVIYYGYPYESQAQGKKFTKLKVRVRAPIPPEVKGRTLTIARANAKTKSEEKATAVRGDAIDVEVEVPARGAVSLTVR